MKKATEEKLQEVLQTFNSKNKQSSIALVEQIFAESLKETISEEGKYLEGASKKLSSFNKQVQAMIEQKNQFTEEPIINKKKQDLLKTALAKIVNHELSLIVAEQQTKAKDAALQVLNPAEPSNTTTTKISTALKTRAKNAADNPQLIKQYNNNQVKITDINLEQVMPIAEYFGNKLIQFGNQRGGEIGEKLIGIGATLKDLSSLPSTNGVKIVSGYNEQFYKLKDLFQRNPELIKQPDNQTQDYTPVAKEMESLFKQISGHENLGKVFGWDKSVFENVTKIEHLGKAFGMEKSVFEYTTGTRNLPELAAEISKGFNRFAQRVIAAKNIGFKNHQRAKRNNTQPGR